MKLYTLKTVLPLEINQFLKILNVIKMSNPKLRIQMPPFLEDHFKGMVYPVIEITHHLEGDEGSMLSQAWSDMVVDSIEIYNAKDYSQDQLHHIYQVIDNNAEDIEEELWQELAENWSSYIDQIYGYLK